MRCKEKEKVTTITRKFETLITNSFFCFTSKEIVHSKESLYSFTLLYSCYPVLFFPLTLTCTKRYILSFSLSPSPKVLDLIKEYKREAITVVGNFDSKIGDKVHKKGKPIYDSYRGFQKDDLL